MRWTHATVVILSSVCHIAMSGNMEYIGASNHRRLQVESSLQLMKTVA